jgi:hypothetical protein
MKPTTILEAIIPVAQEENTVWLCMTTPKGQDSDMARLLNSLDEDGLPIITIIRVGRPCAECRAKQILCVHAENAKPTGTSSKKRRRYQGFYRGGNEFKMMQELQGESGSSNMVLFHQDWLLKLAERKLAPVVGPIDFILISIDPAQGGTCDWGMCVCYYDLKLNGGTQIITQLDAFKLLSYDNEAFKAWLKLSINYVRSSHAAFALVPIVIACESAPKVISLQIYAFIQELINERHIQDVTMMTEIGKGNQSEPGVPKNNVNTQQMVRYTQNLLQTGHVAFSEAFRTSVANRTADAAMRDFFKQLMNVKLRVEEKPNGTKLLKISGKSGNENDDLAVAYIMNALWYYRFYISDRIAYNNIKNRSKQWRGDNFIKMSHPVLTTTQAEKDTYNLIVDTINSTKKHLF